MTDYTRYSNNEAGEGIGYYGYLTKAPWGTYWNVMKEVKIEYGITHTGSFSFHSCIDMLLSCSVHIHVLFSPS